jgi:hypothetical protein
MQVFVAQGKRRRAQSTILESESLIKALTQQTELDDKSLTDIVQVCVGVGLVGAGAVCATRLPREGAGSSSSGVMMGQRGRGGLEAA